MDSDQSCKLIIVCFLVVGFLPDNCDSTTNTSLVQARITAPFHRHEVTARSFSGVDLSSDCLLT
jgi:hypothetical protein